ISLLAIGLVIFTSCIVAYVSSVMIPGFTLALGFLLGGIISPPDAVAATSILRNIRIPKRIVSILEGESLVNDASSLIVFRFALSAVLTGHFVFQEAVGNFFLVAGMGVGVGLSLAVIFYLIHKYLPTTPSIDTALTLMAPYIMYMTAEHFHFSGVMAVVSGGLFLSYHAHEIFNHESRLQGQGVWATITFVLNGLVFILIGLALPNLVERLDGYSLPQAIGYGLVISVVTIIVRIFWVYPNTFIPRWISKSIREHEPNPGLRGPFIVGWSGMRGVVSLASALAIPLTLPDGTAFPYRNLILFITFVVILVTLVFQGLTLPWVIRWLKVKDAAPKVSEVEQETDLRLKLMRAGLFKLQQDYQKEMESNDLVANLKLQMESNISITAQKLESLVCDMTEKEEYQKIMIELIEAQRKELITLRKGHNYDDTVLRKQEAQLDLDEAKLTQHIH
ncbi:MAG TPA: Na+/H+ antiporter, partial [Cytophagales bacterium]|nr:Na+/H+ antiporter [Cytophagales bacterium]